MQDLFRCNQPKEANPCLVLLKLTGLGYTTVLDDESPAWLSRETPATDGAASFHTKCPGRT